VLLGERLSIGSHIVLASRDDRFMIGLLTRWNANDERRWRVSFCAHAIDMPNTSRALWEYPGLQLGGVGSATPPPLVSVHYSSCCSTSTGKYAPVFA
jgi:hypothetical protein